MNRETRHRFLGSVIRGVFEQDEGPARKFLINYAWKLNLSERAAVYRTSVALRDSKTSPTAPEQIDRAVIQALEASHLAERRHFSP